jgi:zinc protease
MSPFARIARGLGSAMLLVSLAQVLPAAQAGQSGQPKKIITIEGITEYQLDNGVRFLLFPDPSASTVTVNMTVLVGSRHEGYGETGMAHLLEHMLFKGTPTFPNMDKALQDHGAGDTANGTTWVDRTNYYETMPANDKNLEFGIRFEADRLVNCFVKREDLVKEMTVVRNEFERGENDPSSILSQRMLAVAFEWHNYGKSTIGNRSDIERVPIDRLQAFYKKHYQPDNVVLIVAGKFDEEKALGYISKYFGALKRPARALDKTYTEEPAQDGERTVLLRRVGKVAVVGAIYHVPAASHADFAAVDVLNTILVSEPRGRLYKALVETKKATSVSGSAYTWHDPSVLEFGVSVNDKVNPEQVRDIMLSVLETLAQGAQGKVSEAEVARAKAKLLAERERALTKSSRISIELSEWVGAGDWRLLFLHRDRLAKVTVADVQRVAEKYLKQTNRTVGLFLPTEQAARTEIPAAPAVAELIKDYKGGPPIAPGEAFETTPGNLDKRIQRLELPGGLKLALLPKKTRGEAVVAELRLRFGNEKSLTGKTVAAAFLGDLMTRGTKNRTREEIEDELDILGASLSGSSGTGNVSFSLQTKREKLPAVLTLLGEMLRTPTFPEKEFDILKRATRQALEKGLTEPDSLADNALRRQLSPFPKDNIRYVPTLTEQIARLDNVTCDDVVKLYHEQLGATAGECVIVGDFDAEAVVKQLKSILGDWKLKVPYERIPAQAKTKTPGSRDVINTPEKENAVYVAGYLFDLKESSPEYPALLIGNYILGGSYTSRIWDRLRQQEGLSYGSGSRVSVDAKDDYGSFSFFAICNPENMTKADRALTEVFDKVLKDGVTAAEVDEATKGYLLEREVARSRDGQLLGTIRQGLYLGRTFAYDAELEKRIAALTADDVNRALRSYLIPKRMNVIHAGDFAKKGK